MNASVPASAYLSTPAALQLRTFDRERDSAAEVDRWTAWQLAHLAPAMSRVAFERMVKPLTRQGAPDQQVIDAAASEFAAASAVLDQALAAKDHVAGPLSIADFALAAHYSLAEACALDISRFPRLESWLARMVARRSMVRALADARVPA